LNYLLFKNKDKINMATGTEEFDRLIAQAFETYGFENEKMMLKRGLLEDQRVDAEYAVIQKIKDSGVAFDTLTAAQQKAELEQRKQTSLYEKTLGGLKDQLESTVALTKTQYDSIHAAEMLQKAKDREIDTLKNAEKNYASMITSINSVTGAIALYKTKQLEAAAGNADATAKVVGKFALMELGTTAVSAGFNYIVDSTKAAYAGMMAYNAALVTAADGITLASTEQLAVLDSQATSIGTASSSFFAVGAAAGTTALAMGALKIPALSAAFGLAAVAAPVSLVTIGLFALATLLGLGGAAILKDQQLKKEKEAQDRKLGNQLNDKLYDSYMNIGKAGLVGSQGLTGLKDNAHKAGFALKDIDKFTSVLKTSQKEMSLFAGGAAAGVDKFASVTGEMTAKLGNHFRNLGISIEEQAEETAKYMALQARLGLLQGKTVTELATGAGKYLEELDKTATLLGSSRKEQEDARGAVMAIEQLRAAMMAAQASGNTEESEKLERYLQQAVVLQERGLTKESAGVAKLGASGGAVTDDDTVIARQMYSNDYFKKLDKGTATTIELTRQLAKETQTAYERTALGFARTGVDPGMTGGKFGKAADMTTAVKLQEKTGREEAAKKGLVEGTPEYNKFFEDFLVAQKKATDEEGKKAQLLREQQVKDNIAADNRLIEVSNNFMGATNIFSDAVNKFAGKNDDVGKRSSNTGASSDPTALKVGQQGAPVPVAANYSKTQMFTPQEARNILDGNPSARDLKDFGGREALEKKAEGVKGLTGREQLTDAGLTIKRGDVQKEGSSVDPKLIEIAKQAQASIPGFEYFSGFNDQYHQEKSPASKHTKGLAFDFVVNPGPGRQKPSKERSDTIISMLKGMGLSKVENEYDNPSKKATGGHFHAELAMPKAFDGGLFDGPKSGYAVELHGREAIVPMPDPSSTIKMETNSPDKTPLSSVVNNNSNSQQYNTTDLMSNIFEMMSSKMDEMIDRLDMGNNYSDKLVKAMV
jgi:hypothetical protein